MSKAVRDNKDFNEASISHALQLARGDIFVAAQLLSVTTLHLDRCLRKSNNLMNLVATIEQVKGTEEYNKITQKQFEEDVARRMSLYRSDALDSLHQIATMPLDPLNPMSNQVKLSAASKLVDGIAQQASGSGQDAFMRELNEAYHAAAPRIKSVRKVETIVELKDEREIS